MKFPAQFSDLTEAAAKLPGRPLHLAIGVFDGVHRGHRAVVEPAIQAARTEGGLAGVLTFWPHPSALFRPEQPTRLMHDPATRARMLLTLGVDGVITQPFTPELAAVEAEAFLPWLKVQLRGLVAVYVGENFRFGRGRRGDAALLSTTGRECGVKVVSAPRVKLDGEPISSTRVRALLEAGDVAAANALLGYPYFSEGIVTPGKRLGRTIGFPTLNIPWAPPFRPRLGVYAVQVRAGEKGAAMPGVANYGVRPTVEKTDEPRLEVHVLGECPVGEGDAVKVEWLSFLRPEMKFASLDELKTQIGRDRATAEAFFGR